MKKYKYKNVAITTVSGVEKAERLQREGWRIISSSWFTIQFELEVK